MDYDMEMLKEYEDGFEAAKQKWISADEALPDAGIPVLVYRFPNIEIATIYNKEPNEKYWWLQNVGVMDLPNFKWWMPLPKPPKENA